MSRAIILNQSPFYGESGGQVGDQGIISANGFRFRVTETHKRIGDVLVHSGILETGQVTVGDTAFLRVDAARRAAIRANHSATHILHEALRQVLGDHVAQKGSLVDPDRLRFDISHPKPILLAELELVEDKSNGIVLRNEPVVTRLMGVDDAIASGARALFGEKYGDEVRVVSMGTEENTYGSRIPYSIELCGGTHVERTGDIGLISILSESAVSAGVRRIEALTGRAARHHLNLENRRLQTIASSLRVSIGDVVERVTLIADERRKLERELSDAKKRLALTGASVGESEVRHIGSVTYIGRLVEGVDIKDLKSLVDDQKAKIGSGVVALGVVSPEGRAGLVIGVTADLVERLNAVDLVRLGSDILGGKGGGGRPDMAQAGGPDGAKMHEAFAAIADAIASVG